MVRTSQKPPFSVIKCHIWDDRTCPKSVLVYLIKKVIHPEHEFGCILFQQRSIFYHIGVTTLFPTFTLPMRAC